MDLGIKVGDIMTRDFIWTKPETNLRDCAKLMIKKRVGSLVIKEEDKLLGLLTEKDILWAVVKKSKNSLKDILAKDLMKRKVVTVKPSADINEAMKKFTEKKVRRLPVVENGKLIGLITTKDVFRVEPGLCQLVSENAIIKKETQKLKSGKIKSSFKTGICEVCGNEGPLLNEGIQLLCEDCFENR